MNVTELKRITAALSTYATVREKAQGPESKIGVQVSKDGTIKLIAGGPTGGVVVDVGGGGTTSGSFAIDARPFLSATKVIKGKLDLSFAVTEDRISIVTDKGGRIECKATDTLREVGFAPKPKGFLAKAAVDGPMWSQIGRVFVAVQRDFEPSPPTMHFYDDIVALTAKSPVRGEMYATVSLPADRVDEQERYGTAYMDFWRSLKVLDAAGTLEFGDKGVVARSGNIECYSAPYKVTVWNPKTRTSSPPANAKPHPTLGWDDAGATGRVTIDRKTLIEAIKGQASSDEYQRVTLRVDTGKLEVYGFGAETGLTLPTATQGKGVRSVQSELMLDLLRAFDNSKEIELAWGQAPGIRLHGKEYISWTVLIAPVTMNK